MKGYSTHVTERANLTLIALLSDGKHGPLTTDHVVQRQRDHMHGRLRRFIVLLTTATVLSAAIPPTTEPSGSSRREDAIDVGLALLHGARKFVAKLATVTLPTALGGPVDQALAAKETQAMVNWYCAQPGQQRQAAFVCRRRAAVEKPAVEKPASVSIDVARTQAVVPKVPPPADNDARKAVLAEARQMLGEFCGAEAGRKAQICARSTAMLELGQQAIGRLKGAIGLGGGNGASGAALRPGAGGGM